VRSTPPGTPDGIIALDAYRVFQLDVSRRRLQSVTGFFEWEPDVTEADCNFKRYPFLTEKPLDHLAPDEACTCGLYAMKELSTVMTSRAPSVALVREWRGGYQIIARVRLWGKVIEATDGYRAQFGTVGAIYVPPAFATAARDLAEVYGCSVLELDEYGCLTDGPLDGWVQPVGARSEGDLIRIRCRDEPKIWWWATRTQASLGRARVYRRALPHASKLDARIIVLRFGLLGRGPLEQEEVAAATGVDLTHVQAVEGLAIAGIRRLEEQHPNGCTAVAVYRRVGVGEYHFEGLAGQCPLWGRGKKDLTLSR
jgi:hypothetical protein